MTKEQLNLFVGNCSMTILEVMEKIDKNTSGALFIQDDKEQLCGCITDGDIRRWILKAGNLKTPVCEVMNRSPKYIFEEEYYRADKIMKQQMITTLPIVNSTRHIVDILILNKRDVSIEDNNIRMLECVPVVVMAGGKGTRLYPYTKILPKPLIPIGDTPIVERIIDYFVNYGVKKYFMTVNYKKGMIKSYFNDLKPDYEIEYVEEPKALGTCGSIKLIKEKFARPLFVINCDAIILADYSKVYNYHLKSGNAITMVSALKNITVPYGVIHSGDNGEILSMEEKPKLSCFVNTGMYIIDPETIDLIPNDTVFHMTQLIDTVMKNGGKVGMYPVSEDSFLDMGEFSEMKRMEEKLNIVFE
mgnify:CR=1 FL=1